MEKIAERKLTYQDEAGHTHPLTVEISRPEEDRGAWRCKYNILGVYSHAGVAYGGDSVQALLLSLQAVAAHMNTPKLRGRVSMPAQEGHGFPAPPRPETP